MVTNDKYVHSLLVCEIGPIFDFVRHSRKTKDYWSASFLFSYFMADVARTIEVEDIATRFRPYLDDNPLMRKQKDVPAGDVPDQLFFVLEEKNMGAATNALKNSVSLSIGSLVKKIEAEAENGSLDNKWLNPGKICQDEVKRFFRLFWIFHPIAGPVPTYDEMQAAESKIKQRAMLIEYEHLTGVYSIPKWKKCNLCGDREAVYAQCITETSKKPDEASYDWERICSVCLFKRFLPEALKGLVRNPEFDSSSDLAAVPFYQHQARLISAVQIPDVLTKNLKIAYEKHVVKCKNHEPVLKGQSNLYDSVFGRCLYRTESNTADSLRTLKQAFKSLEDELVKIDPSYERLRWLDRPFYSIVYMDGDRMGKVAELNKENFQKFVPEVSKVLSKFAREVPNIVAKHHGQLIFCGGDDVNFMIHPEYLLKCLIELQTRYTELFRNNPGTQKNADELTLSAGAIVCYHKFPLSEAIRQAYDVMTYNAKTFSQKNATAIKLVKGHTESLTLTLSNALLSEIEKLEALFLRGQISRTTPHRINAERDLLKQLLGSDRAACLNYLTAILSGTRGDDSTRASAKEKAEFLMKFADRGIDTLIDAMLYARFLTGE